MTALNKQALRSKARSASAGEWIKESGDGWEAISSSDDQANGNFIIAHFEGPDAKVNREFVQVANPATVLALLDDLEAAEKRIEELDERTPYGYLRQCDGQIQISIGSERPHDRSGGYATPWFAIYTAAGIGVKER
ncbi:ead/Ea22-like family protein [Citrobacter portucalensis]|uniref:ead/Ea22-like family protein n=1 Tax=Citrobacter portucalensis TaxID=1639133 RepID=UPI00339BE195